MATIEENVKALQAKLEEAEKQLFEKEEKERLEKERSWEYNVDVIQKNIKSATAGKKLPMSRMGNFSGRRKSIPLPSNWAERSVCNYLQPFMSSVLECLQRLDERVQDLEENLKIDSQITYH